MDRLIYFTLCSRLNNSLLRQLTGEKAGLPFMVRMMRTPVNVLGCSLPEFATHIESNFVDGMAWSNIDEWHIDHIYPIAAVNVYDDTEVFAACNFRNLRPLWASSNCSKGASVTHGIKQHFKALCDLVRQPWHRTHTPHPCDEYREPPRMTIADIDAMPPGGFAKWVAECQRLAQFPLYGDFVPPP